LNGTSLEVQEKRCKAFAELHNFNIDYVYSEIVSGGVEFRKRPVFQKVLKELKSGSKLVVSRLDRLSRKVVDTLSLVDDFKKEHKEICITDIGNIHTDGVSKIFVTILASLAEIERENISIRIKASRPYAVIVPSGVDVLNISNGDFEWGLFVNATLASSFSYTSFSDNVEYDLQTTAFSTAGTRIAGGYLGGKTAPFTLGGDFIAFANQLGQTIAGVSDTLTLGVRPGTANGDVSGLLKWYDLT
jgi:hypothetical protein